MTFISAAAALAAVGHIARTGELRARGVTTRELARASNAGEIRRVRRGVYAGARTDDGMLHAAEHGGSVSCTTAGRMLGLWILQEAAGMHLWLGREGNLRRCTRSRCAVRAHWDDGDGVLGRIPPVRNVLVQIAECAGEEMFFAALESALRQSLLHPSDLRWLARRLPRDLHWLLAFARADADSGLESLVRLRLHRLGISVRTQVLIDGVGEVDFVIGERLIVEADGKENHDDVSGATGPSRRHKDLQRDARAAALGYETLRFDYAMIVYHWPVVAAAIQARVAVGAHLMDDSVHAVRG